MENQKPANEETKTEIQKIEKESSLVPTNLYGNKDFFDHAQRVAIMLSKSDLVPKIYQGNTGNCLIALEMANRIGASPLMVMQSLYIVHGKPAWSSAFLIATVNQCGKFSPLRYEEDEKNGGRVRAWAIDLKNNEKLFSIWVSMEMAKAEGWIDKSGSKWKTMPQLMLRYRAATFFARQFAPEISMGIHTQEEIQDTPYVEVTQQIKYEDLVELLDLKAESLTAEEMEDARRIISNKEVQSYKKLHSYLISK